MKKTVMSFKLKNFYIENEHENYLLECKWPQGCGQKRLF